MLNNYCFFLNNVIPASYKKINNCMGQFWHQVTHKSPPGQILSLVTGTQSSETPVASLRSSHGSQYPWCEQREGLGSRISHTVITAVDHGERCLEEMHKMQEAELKIMWYHGAEDCSETTTDCLFVCLFCFWKLYLKQKLSFTVFGNFWGLQRPLPGYNIKSASSSSCEMNPL